MMDWQLFKEMLSLCCTFPNKGTSSEKTFMAVITRHANNKSFFMVDYF